MRREDGALIARCGDRNREGTLYLSEDNVKKSIQTMAIASILAVFMLAACGDDTDAPDDTRTYEGDDGLMAEVVLNPDPPQSGAVDMTMELFVDGDPLEDATVDIEVWMPSHGHGAATEPVVQEVGDGLYEVDDLSFSMAGQWQLTIDVDWDGGESQLLIDLDVGG